MPLKALVNMTEIIGEITEPGPVLGETISVPTQSQMVENGRKEPKCGDGVGLSKMGNAFRNYRWLICPSWHFLRPLRSMCYDTSTIEAHHTRGLLKQLQGDAHAMLPISSIHLELQFFIHPHLSISHASRSGSLFFLSASNFFLLEKEQQLRTVQYLMASRPTDLLLLASQWNATCGRRKGQAFYSLVTSRCGLLLYEPLQPILLPIRNSSKPFVNPNGQ